MFSLMMNAMLWGPLETRSGGVEEKGSDDTTVPLPTVRNNNPEFSNSLIDSRTEAREMPYLSAISRSDGIRHPGWNRPFRISCSSNSFNWERIGVGLSE